MKFFRQWSAALVWTAILTSTLIASYAVKRASSQSIVVTGPSGGIGGYPTNARILTNVVTGTGAIVTAAIGGASPGYTTYVCGFSMSAIGVATPFPISVSGTKDNDFQYVATSTVSGGPLAAQNWYPCIAASAAQQAISVSTGSNPGGATIKINLWGFEIPS